MRCAHKHDRNDQRQAETDQGEQQLRTRPVHGQPQDRDEEQWRVAGSGTAARVAERGHGGEVDERRDGIRPPRQAPPRDEQREQDGRSGEDRADGEPGEVRHVYRDHDRDGARERKRRDAPCESLSIERARPQRRGLATVGGRP